MGGSWRRLHSLPHPALVNGIAWCALPGKGPKLQLLLATYVIFLFVLALLQLGILLLVVGRIKKKKKKILSLMSRTNISSVFFQIMFTQ